MAISTLQDEYKESTIISVDSLCASSGEGLLVYLAAKEKEILVEQMKEDPKMANKPEQVLEKIVSGKIGKFYKENCLVDQQFVKDSSLSVSKYVEQTAKKLGGDIKVTGFIRYERGEGLEKRNDNFAEEIASLVNG